VIPQGKGHCQNCRGLGNLHHLLPRSVTRSQRVTGPVLKVRKRRLLIQKMKNLLTVIGLVLSLSAFSTEPLGIQKQKHSPVEVEVFLKGNWDKLPELLPYLTIEKVFPKKIRLNLGFVINRDPVTGELGENTTAWMAKITKLRQSDRVNFSNHVLCVSYDRPQVLCNNLFLEKIKVTTAEISQAQKQALQNEARLQDLLDPKDRNPVVLINGSIYKGSSRFVDLFAELNENLPKNSQLPLPEHYKKPDYPAAKMLVLEELEPGAARDSAWESILRRKYSNLQLESVKLSTFEGQQLFSAQNPTALPAYYIAAEELKKSAAFQESFSKSYHLQPAGEYFSVPREGPLSRRLMNEKRIPGELVLWLDSDNEEGRYFESQILAKLESGSWKGIRFRTRFVTFLENGKLTNYRPEYSQEENQRQALIQKYFPEKYFKYLKHRNPRLSSTYWDLSAREAGLDPNWIRKNLAKADLLLMEDANYVAKHKLTGGLTFIWENQQVLGDRLPTEQVFAR
jgi:hypothetical protein